MGIGSQFAILPKETFEQYCSLVEQFFERHKVAVVGCISLMYFGGTVLRARAKPFWFDEILTLLAARLPTYAATVHAARDIDWTPPFTDLVAHIVHGLAGSGEIVFRVPSMIGFWVFCLCLFAFAAKRVNMFFALGALLLPFVTTGESYSFEARSYGMMLGFCGIALLSWQFAAAGEKRALALAGICVGIGGAVLCHYYGVMIYVPLAGAELLRSYRKRKIDKAIWAAFILRRRSASGWDFRPSARGDNKPAPGYACDQARLLSVLRVGLRNLHVVFDSGADPVGAVADHSREQTGARHRRWT